LNETGENEAIKAGRDLKKAGYHFDIAHTSMLDRAHKTNSLLLEEMNLIDHTEIK
jgi:2,3-bisphosphoglycerate-dependent phosphoglycerate mutase